MNTTLSIEQSDDVSPRIPESALLRIVKVLTLLIGLAIIFMGVMLGSLYLLLSLTGPQAIGGSGPNTGIAGFSMFALTLGIGGALVFQTVSTLSKRPSSIFHLPSPIIFILAFLIVIGLGVLISWAGHISWILFPFFYVLGIALPIGWVMASVGGRVIRSGTRLTWRETILQLSSGAFITTSLALLFEALVVVGVLVIAVVAIMLTPGGQKALEALVENLQSFAWTQDAGNLEAMIFSPVVIASLFFLLAVAVPMIEELFKAVGVILMSYRRPSRQQALWWGLLGGAGFAFAEGLFNGNLAVGDMSWGILAPMRFGTTILHCTTGALMGLGWYALLRHRQFLQWLKRYIQAVALHSVWNALSLSLVFILPDVSPDAPNMLSGAIPGIILTSILILQAVGMVILLLRLVRQPPPSEKAEAT